MSDRSLIECTDATWNPVTGCTKVSAGCKHCYAERHWQRLRGNPNTVYYQRPFSDVRTHADRLDQPRRWRKPRRIFVNSMSDLFHGDLPFEYIHLLWSHMAAAHRHRYQILTKRPARAAAFFQWNAALPADQRIRPYCRNIWVGVSAETQATLEERVPILLRLPVGLRWVCVEPLLEAVELRGYLGRQAPALPPESARCEGCVPPRRRTPIDWVVVGGEGGPRARACHVGWIRDVVAACRRRGVPVFVRQLGAAACEATGAEPLAPEARKVGHPEHWPVDLQVQEFPG